MDNLESVLQEGKYTLIDVREPMELDLDGAIEGAINIPLGEIEERANEILAIDGNVILFCRSGNRSGQALTYLQSQGLQKGFNGGGYAELSQKIG